MGKCKNQLAGAVLTSTHAMFWNKNKENSIFQFYYIIKVGVMGYTVQGHVILMFQVSLSEQLVYSND